MTSMTPQFEDNREVEIALAAYHSQLLAAAKRALTWFDNRVAGNAKNGPSEDIAIARDLAWVIDCLENAKRQVAEREALLDRR